MLFLKLIQIKNNQKKKKNLLRKKINTIGKNNNQFLKIRIYLSISNANENVFVFNHQFFFFQINAISNPCNFFEKTHFQLIIKDFQSFIHIIHIQHRSSFSFLLIHSIKNHSNSITIGFALTTPEQNQGTAFAKTMQQANKIAILISKKVFQCFKTITFHIALSLKNEHFQKHDVMFETLFNIMFNDLFKRSLSSEIFHFQDDST